MTIALPKGDFLVTAGFAAIAGAGIASIHTVFANASTWYSVLVAAITLGAYPLLAGSLSPPLRNVALFPISVLFGLSVASAIDRPLSSDPHPIWFIFVLTIVYGGGASVAFCVGWTARQYLLRLRGHRMPMSHLAMASLGAVCLSFTLMVRYFGFAAIPDLSGLIGVVAGTAIIWSDRHRGRWRSLGLGLSLLYLGASIGMPVYLGADIVKGLVYMATGYGWVALALVGLAVWNILKWRQDGERAALGDS